MHVLGGTYELIKRGGNAHLACGEWFCANRRRQGIIVNEKIHVSLLRNVNFNKLSIQGRGLVSRTMLPKFKAFSVFKTLKLNKNCIHIKLLVHPGANMNTFTL